MTDDDYPCQGDSPLCTGGGADVPFGLCSVCRAHRDARAAVLDLGPALRDRRAPWHPVGLDPLPLGADVCPPRWAP